MLVLRVATSIALAVVLFVAFIPMTVLAAIVAVVGFIIHTRRRDDGGARPDYGLTA